MNLTTLALRRPLTVLVAIIAAVLVGIYGLQKMQRDVFPDLGVPTIYVAQPYGGMDPAQMEGLITNYYEYHFLYINGIEHVESKSIQGVALIKLQFHPGTDMSRALAETVSYVNRSRAFMPPGTIPPFIMRFDAGSVPVGNLVFSSDDPKLQLKDLQDAALFKVRPMFATLPGVSAPPPFGGSPRTMVIRADPEKLRSFNMSPDEVVSAIAKGNVISPSGNVRIGDQMPIVPVNSLATVAKDLEAVPIRPNGTQTVFVRDIAKVEDSSDIQTGFAIVNGRRTVYIPVTKRADASTLSVVGLVKENLPKFQAALPPGVKVSYEFDQSPYVTRAIWGLAEEGMLGAVLTGLVVVLFLRDWRSSIVVILNIPLALLAAAMALWITGQTVNLMTLGGLALAVGILVDEATVTIENVHTHLARGEEVPLAALKATRETNVPRLLAMLCVLAVFIPTFFMQGAARNLFIPLALAVAFSMIASYVLSSTLVPILAIWILRRSDGRGGEGESGRGGENAGRFSSRPLSRSPPLPPLSPPCGLGHRRPLDPRSRLPPRDHRLRHPGGEPARPRNLPDHRRRPVHPSHACPNRHAPREDRANRPAGPGDDRQGSRRREHPDFDGLRRRSARRLSGEHHPPLDQRPRGSGFPDPAQAGQQQGGGAERTAAAQASRDIARRSLFVRA
jgi:multidrug efflux pump subunit AcrB